MKRILPVLLLSFLLVFFLSSIAFATEETEGSTTSGSPRKDKGRLEELRTQKSGKIEDLGERFQERRELFADKREELKSKLEQKQQELKNKRFEKALEKIKNILERRNEALERLDNIADKIQNRINKLKEKGVDTAAAEAALAACSAKKTEAASSIQSAEDGILGIDFNATNAKELAQAQVQAIQRGNEAVKSYHSCLVDVVRSLKAIQKPTQSPSATQE